MCVCVHKPDQEGKYSDDTTFSYKNLSPVHNASTLTPTLFPFEKEGVTKHSA